MLRIAAFIVVIGAMLAAGPVEAQFGNFSDSPPRPPADIPNGASRRNRLLCVSRAYSPSSSNIRRSNNIRPPTQPQLSGGRSSLRRSGRCAEPSPVARAPSGIQAQPLPPPPGVSLARQRQTVAIRATVGSRRRNAGAGQSGGTATGQYRACAQFTGQEDDTTVIETPTEKIENGRAVFAGLDKITGRTIKFDAAIGETVQFGALQVTARACYTRPPTEPTNTDAFVEVDEVTLQGEIKRIFTGWMFASSPDLNAVEHPIYDVWLTGCAQPLTGPVAESTPMPPPPGTPGPVAEPAPRAAAAARQAHAAAATGSSRRRRSPRRRPTIKPFNLR